MSNIEYYERLATRYALFFSNLAANSRQEGEWLNAELRQRGVGRVLDASCGTGRQALPLARYGYGVVAADPSAAMLREARRHAGRDGLDIAFQCAGFTDLPGCTQDRFDAVVALGNGLCHLESPREIVDSLASMRSMLRRGGTCLVGIKEYDRIRRERPAIHKHAAREHDGERIALIERWSYREPHLLCAAYITNPREPNAWSAQGVTREYMVGSRELAGFAYKAGFTRLKQLDHPSEAVFLLRQ